MGERGKDRLPCNQPGKQKNSYNEKKAVERITAQRHACERHQQEMRQKHDVILQKLSHRDNELRHILQQLTREQSSLTYNGDDGNDNPQHHIDRRRVSVPAYVTQQLVVDPYPVTFPSDASRNKRHDHTNAGRYSDAKATQHTAHHQLRRCRSSSNLLHLLQTCCKETAPGALSLSPLTLKPFSIAIGTSSSSSDGHGVSRTGPLSPPCCRSQQSHAEQRQIHHHKQQRPVPNRNSQEAPSSCSGPKLSKGRHFAYSGRRHSSAASPVRANVTMKTAALEGRSFRGLQRGDRSKSVGCIDSLDLDVMHGSVSGN